MSKFVTLNGAFDITQNFWTTNPQFIFITPWNKLYEMDGGGEYSSKLAWTVYCISDPDENENKFYKFGREKVQEMFEETYFKQQKPDWNNEHYLACLEAFPEQCMDSIQKSYAMKKESIRKLGKFLDEQEYSLANIKDLTMVHSKMPKIYEEYEKIEERFFAGKQRARVKGGRRESKSERKEV